MIARKKITDYRVQQVIRIVEQDPKHRVKSLAKLVNLSASRLEHLFKEETGGKMSLFIQDQKLRRATLLLRTTRMQVKEISYTVGYEHPTSFVRAFKEKYNLTPKNYRGQVRLAELNAEARPVALSF